MADRPLRILQVTESEINGGAERVSRLLFDGFRARGMESWMAVGRKLESDPNVYKIPNREMQSAWRRTLLNARDGITGTRGVLKLARGALWRAAQPGRIFRNYWGIHEYDFPGSWRVLDLPPQPPDILHLHNLHGNFFDLRALPTLSAKLPIVLTLHDAWMLSGHCAHSFDCDRWLTGCGHCPDLTITPAVRRDSTAHNWRWKRDIFRRSRMYIAAGSRWLMQKVEQSMLAGAMVQGKVIHNAVDLQFFNPGDKQAARAALGIDPTAKVLLFAANGIRDNVFKDYRMMREAVERLSEKTTDRLLFLALGETSAPERIGRAEVQFVPYQKSPEILAQYYRAADVYLHAARGEVWGLTITEALACGTPVVATAVGGIPEQIQNLTDVGPDRATGALVPRGDAAAMAAAAGTMLADPTLLARLGKNAAEDARVRFDVARQVEEYLSWYGEILNSQGKN